MKRYLVFVCFFAGATLVFADHRAGAYPRRLPLLDEIVRLSGEGFSDETIIAYMSSRRSDLPSMLAADDLIWLRRSRVSEAVIRFLVSETAIDVGPTGDVVYDDRYGSDVYPVDVGYSAYPSYFYGSYYPYYAYSGTDYAYHPPYYFGGRHFGGRDFGGRHLGGDHHPIRGGGHPGSGGHYGHRGFAAHGLFGSGHASAPHFGGGHAGFSGHASIGHSGFGHGGRGSGHSGH